MDTRYPPFTLTCMAEAGVDDSLSRAACLNIALRHFIWYTGGQTPHVTEGSSISVDVCRGAAAVHD